MAPKAPKAQPKVGLFVSTLHDLTPPEPRRVISETQAFQKHGVYWWGRPAFANGDLREYRWSNAKMLDYHIGNFRELGIDFIFLDFTNGNHQGAMDGARNLCLRLQQRGAATLGPRVVFWIQKPEYAELYKKEFYEPFADIMFQWQGKPLLLLQGVDDGWRPAAGKTKPLPKVPGFTARWCWGLLGPASGTMWTFKELKPPNPYVHKGNAEQIGVTFASQQTYMSTAEGRRCREGGAFFRSQIPNVLAHNPEIVTICGYNEWSAINLGQPGQPPVFTDVLSPECSHDIEPMKGGHGDTYFRIAQRFVADLKTRSI